MTRTYNERTGKYEYDPIPVIQPNTQKEIQRLSLLLQKCKVATSIKQIRQILQ